MSCASEDALAIVWTERGKPQVNGPVGEPGYGSTLVSRVMANQLGGSIERDWSPEGVIITLRLDKGRLAS